MKSIYGVVILYHPDRTILRNILSYINPLKKLYVMDNSEEPKKDIIDQIKQIKKVEYISMSENKGIAYPINQILQRLEKDSWLLTMDQDSYFYKNTFEEYVKVIQIIDFNRVYGITPQIKSSIKNIEKSMREKIIKKEKCIQSGAIFNVEIAQKAGGFEEKFFIDGIDTEYCFKCNLLGYILIKNFKGILIHKLGEVINNSLFSSLGLKITQHNYLRRYYIVRNNLFIKDKYRNKTIYVFLYLFLGIIKIAIFDDDKKRKFKSIKRGYFDYRRKIYGMKILR